MILISTPTLFEAWVALTAHTARRAACVLPWVRRRYAAEQREEMARLLEAMHDADEDDEDEVGAWMDGHGFNVEAHTHDDLSEADEVELYALVRAVQESEQMQALKRRAGEMADMTDVVVNIQVMGLDNGSGDAVD